MIVRNIPDTSFSRNFITPEVKSLHVSSVISDQEISQWARGMKFDQVVQYVWQFVEWLNNIIRAFL